MEPLNRYRKVDGYVATLHEAIVAIMEADDVDDSTVVHVTLARGEHEDAIAYFVDIESVVNMEMV